MDPNEATELEAPIRLYIRETALHEKVLEAIPPSGPRGSKPWLATCFWKGAEGGGYPYQQHLHSLIQWVQDLLLTQKIKLNIYV